MTEKITRANIENIPAGKFEQPSTDLVFSFVAEALAKQRNRTRLLSENPEARISVNPSPLREILPDSALVCYTGSSIAKNRSIKGSDIDGAIVITPIETTLEQQRQYVFCLRSQGFKVYSPEQIQNIEQNGHLQSNLGKKQDILFKVITFETFDEFEAKRKSGASLVHTRIFVVYAEEE